MKWNWLLKLTLQLSLETEPASYGRSSAAVQKKKRGGEPGGEKLPQLERVLGALPFLVGCVKRLFLVYFKPTAF